MSKSYLKSQRICLRAMEPEDLSVMYEIENNPAYWDVSSFTVPYSWYVLKQYIEISQNDLFADKQLRLMIVNKDNDTVIGCIDISDYVPLHSRGAVGIAILDKYRREGYATEALKLLCDYAFGFLHLKQLYAFIPEDNEPSLKLFTSCGFVQCGLLKDWLHTGNRYKDAVLVQLVES